MSQGYSLHSKDVHCPRPGCGKADCTSVAREKSHLAKININGLRGDSIEEVTVMADHHDALLQRAEVLLQPLYSVEVKVVGWLIKQQVIWMTEKSLTLP